MNLLLIASIKKKIKESSEGNNCNHRWITVHCHKNCGVMCSCCGDILFEDVTKATADKIVTIANSKDSYEKTMEEAR